MTKLSDWIDRIKQIELSDCRARLWTDQKQGFYVDIDFYNNTCIDTDGVKIENDIEYNDLFNIIYHNTNYTVFEIETILSSKECL